MLNLSDIDKHKSDTECFSITPIQHASEIYIYVYFEYNQYNIYLAETSIDQNQNNSLDKQFNEFINCVVVYCN